MKPKHPSLQTSKPPLERPACGSTPKIRKNLRHLRFLALLLLGCSALFIVDATDWALPFETWLAERMASALRCVFVGVGADPALLGTVAPACAGVRTAIGAAILGACLAERRKWLGALVGALCGLGLNLVRLVAVEAALRVDFEAGMMLHDLALYAIVLPAALLAWGLWRICSKPVRVTLAGCALSLAALLAAVDLPEPPPAPRPLTAVQERLFCEAVAADAIRACTPRRPEVDLTPILLNLCPGAGIREGAPAVSRPQFQDDPRRFDTPAPRVRDTGTPAPGQTL